jgi:hypothetical protein
MRRTPAALAVAAVLAAAGVATAAPARGVSFSDAVGDANGLDGASTVGSQPAFDVRRVTLAPYGRTSRTSGLTVRVDLTGPVSASPGSSYVFTAKQGECDLTFTRTITTDGVGASTLVVCGAVVGEYHSHSVSTAPAGGRSVTFEIPAELLPNATVGAQLTAIEVGTAAGEPVSGSATPARIDRAAYPDAYRLGS